MIKLIRKLKICKSMKDLEEEIYEIRDVNSPTKERWVNHKRKHFNCAKKLGYKPMYKCKSIKLDFYFSKYSFHQVSISVKNPAPRDLKEICLAPENPSLLDKFYSSKLFQIPYKFYFLINNNK